MKKLLFLIVIITHAIVLSGCWSKKELTDLAFVIAVGVDKKDGKYVITLQVVNPGNVAGATQRGGGGSGVPVTLYTSTGDTLVEASRKVSKKVSRITYYAHTNLVVIGEQLAREGIKEIFDAIERNPQFRTTASVVIARKQTAEQLLSVLTPIDKIPANQMIKTLEMTETVWGENLNVHAGEIIEDFSLAGKEIVMSSFRLDRNLKKGQQQENVQFVRPPARLRASELAMFKNGKLVRWISGEEARGVLWILNKIKQTAITVDWEGKEESVSYKVMRAKTEIAAKMKKGKPVLTIHVETEGDVGEVLVPIDFTNPANITNLETKLRKEIKKEIQKAIQQAQREKSDIFGLGEVVHRSYPEKWKKMKQTWNEQYFPNISVHVTVDTFIRRTGLRSNPYFP
ncbi:Ger(x)C family spore germination protein [Anoxybacteroides voinovskiense]|uniref:Ger(x)C family spore germination protein n=1 Tax=Anoxybacteroides voinovskiense TaxID=230470 RepID=UPI001605EBAF|nr:Ger(x)C family spore germination protein [Anoxybacillus voinovskiensis]